jgi:membrane protein implicated in regulation of membrane protease activity
VDTSPESWRWIWLVAAMVLIAGEMAVPGTFILIPFGISAAVAMILAFAGVDIIVGWLVFVLLGGALFTIFWKMSRKSMAAMEAPEGAGVNRLIGVSGVLLEAIPDDPSSSGVVKIGGERWRAITDGEPIEEGAVVAVTAVRGTRVVVQLAHSESEKGSG